MAQQKRRPANDRAFKKYKANNQRYKNKIRKMKRHIKKHPKDVIAQENLKRIESNPLPDKRPPQNPNPVRPKPIILNVHKGRDIETVAEQLSRLLGIPLQKRPEKRRKPKITHKGRKSGPGIA